MHFLYKVFVVVCCLKLKYIYSFNVHSYHKGHFRQDGKTGDGDEKAVDPSDQGGAEHPADAGENTENDEGKNSAEIDTTPADKHTFVALIDIVFDDGSKKTCSGAVIHDNVVLTAAHCFVNRHKEYLTPELTFSFVVIGTKKMFETGYEQYLPIEKVVSHPKFNGWTADLAMVFTFAGMTSDKPGQVIPLAGGRSSTPVDSNVTVLSWGRCSNHQGLRERKETLTEEGDRIGDGEDKHNRNHNSNVNVADLDAVPTYNIRYMAKVDQRARDELEIEQTKPTVKTTKRISRYLTSMEGESEEIQKPMVRPGSKGYIDQPNYDGVKVKKNSSDSLGYVHTDLSSKKKQIANTKIKKNTKKNKNIKKPTEDLKFYKNWRRQMGQQKNELAVEVFGFVNVQACKKIVERTMPSLYSIKNHNEILCYSSEDHYITNEDSGAPALQNGHLVAVTVGGVETDGEHIAIGMKMSCFCPWIADNLPDGGGENISCCRNCCNTKHFGGEEKPRHMVYYRHGTGREKVVRFSELGEYEDSDSDVIPQQTTSRDDVTIIQNMFKDSSPGILESE